MQKRNTKNSLVENASHNHSTSEVKNSLSLQRPWIRSTQRRTTEFTKRKCDWKTRASWLKL